MNTIVDILPQQSKHTVTQETPSHHSPIESLQQLNYLVSNFEVTSMLDHDPNLLNNMYLSQDVVRQMMVPQFQPLASSQTSTSFMDQGLFRVSSGKRSPPMGKSEIKQQSKKSDISHTQQKKYLKRQDRTHVHHVSNINSLFRSFPKQTCFDPPSFQQPVQERHSSFTNDNTPIQIEAKSKRENRHFIRQINAQRNFFKLKHTKVRVFNYKQLSKTTEYLTTLKETFASEKINETVPQRFLTKNLQDQQKSQQQVQEQVITDSQPTIPQPPQPVQEQQIQLEDLISSLECREPSILPSIEDPNSAQDSHRSRNFSQDSRRSGNSSSSDEERELFRIFSGLHVLSVNNQVLTAPPQPINSQEVQTISTVPLSRWLQ